LLQPGGVPAIDLLHLPVGAGFGLAGPEERLARLLVRLDHPQQLLAQARVARRTVRTERRQAGLAKPRVQRLDLLPPQLLPPPRPARRPGPCRAPPAAATAWVVGVASAPWRTRSSVPSSPETAVRLAPRGPPARRRPLPGGALPSRAAAFSSSASRASASAPF